MSFRVIFLTGLFLSSCFFVYGQSKRVRTKNPAHEQWKREKQKEIAERKQRRAAQKNQPPRENTIKQAPAPRHSSSSDFTPKGGNTISLSDAKSDAIVQKAKVYLGTKYRPGGNRPSSGFDCSGFTCYVYQQVTGDLLPRRSADQYKLGRKVSLKQASPGDLIFFSHAGGDINHVGIVVSGGGNQVHMIHASSSAGIQIINVEASDYWRKRFRGVRAL